MPKKGIGNTPLWELTRESAFSSSARIFAKAECENLGGSVKDRVAFAILEDAEQKGLLKNSVLKLNSRLSNGIQKKLNLQQRILTVSGTV